jgi:hypothetical protein
MSELVVRKEGGRKQKKTDIVKKGVAGVDNTSRRTWDKDEFEAKAALREAQVKPDPSICKQQNSNYAIVVWNALLS